MIRWGLRCLVVAAVGIALTIVVAFDPAISFAFKTPVWRAVLETAVTIVGGLVALLVIGRYRRRYRRPADLAIAVALAVLALDYPLFVVLPKALLPGRLQDAGDWPYLVAHACAAGLLCWASGQLLAPGADEPTGGIEGGDRLSGMKPIYTVTATALTLVVLLAFFAFGTDAAATAFDSARGSQLFADPGVSAIRLVCFLLFISAAFRFSMRSRRGVDHLVGWLSVGCALLAVGDFDYGLFPPIIHSELHLGDVFRLAAILVFAVGAAAAIHSYWYESRELARLRERRAVAADLHDGVAQELAFLSSHVRATTGLNVSDQWLGQLRSATDRALAESRRAIAALVADRAFTLGADLDGTVQEIAAASSVPVEVDIQTSWPDQASREDIVRIVREAVINAVRHGHPTLVRVSLCGDGWPVLRVVDDGIGFDPKSAEASGGFGLVSMRERAQSMGARFSVESRPGHGTTVEVSWVPEGERA